jgi:pyridoxamine 5'-phosphate oxidase
MKRGTGLFYICIAASTTRTSFGFTRTIQSAAATTHFIKRRMSSETTNSNSSSDDGQSWRSLMEASIAKSRKIRGSNYVQISTVEDGEPRCRTVVFRGWQNLPEDHTLCHEVDAKSCLMKMCTDKRSKKVNQNGKQAITEIVWWFPKSSEQYRIRGPLILVGGENDDRTLEIARKELWGNISDPSRESFLGAVVPGEAYEEDTSDIPAGGRDANGKVLPPPDNFLLMLLDPTDVDYLRLTSDQYRQLDSRGPSSWSSKRVNP